MKLTRFSEDRQDLIEQFVEYAQLMGLSGRDLVAIGGKLDREIQKERKQANMAIIKSFECLPIGSDAQWQLDDRFKLKTVNGAYNFDVYPYYCEVFSLKTKHKKVCNLSPWKHDLPRTEWRTRVRYAMLLEIAAGKFQLNF